jgi:hypothetical protein
LLAESHYSRGAEVHQQRDQPRGCQGRLALRPAIFGFCMFFFSRGMWEEVGVINTDIYIDTGTGPPITARC